MKHLAMFMVPFSLLAFGQSGCQIASGSGVSTDAGMHGLQLNFEGANLDSSVVNTAMGAWNSCSGKLPQLSTNSSSPVSVRIVLENDPAPSNHLGKYNALDGQITLYTMDHGGNTLNNDTLTSVLTHELGHALGLADVPNSSCLMGPYAGSNKTVDSSDCSFLSSMWAPFCP